MDNIKKIYKKTIILSIAFGLIAGVVSVFLLGEFYFNKLYLERVGLEGNNEGSRIIIQSPEKVEVTQDLRIKEVVEQTRPALVSVFAKKQVGKDIMSQIYQEKDFITYGTILTSDGWLVATSEAVKNFGATGLVVIYNNEINAVQKIIKDTATGLTLLKIESVDLPVIKFGSIDDLALGQHLLVINKDDIKLTNLVNANYANGEILHSSERYYSYLLLSANQLPSGSSVINFQGDLVGITVKSSDLTASKALPINFLQNSLKLVLRETEIKYPYLGINFLDISTVSGLNAQAAKGLETGALLYGRGAVRAVNGDSPLFGKILEGDIITKVDEQEINSKVGLSELILGKRSGDLVEIEYVRVAGERDVVGVELE